MAHRGKSLLLVLLSFVLSACASAQAPALRDTNVIAAPPPVPATPEVVSTAASVVVPPAGEAGCPDARGPLDGELVFGAGNSLNMIRSDGGDLRLLLDLPGTFWAHEPAWSPDGSLLAYMLSQPATGGDIPGLQTSIICGLERATGAGRLLLRGSTSTEALEVPAWTPDGQSLVVTRRQTSADRDGHNLRALTEPNLDDPRAAWAPDGASIAFVAGSGGGISLLDVDTGAVRQLTTEGDYGGISWAPTTQAP